MIQELGFFNLHVHPNPKVPHASMPWHLHGLGPAVHWLKKQFALLWGFFYQLVIWCCVTKLSFSWLAMYSGTENKLFSCMFSFV